MDSLIHKVVPYVPGCPEVVAEQHILEASIELAKNTCCWRKEFTTTLPASVAADTITITLTLDTGAKIVAVPRVWRDNIPTNQYSISANDITLPAMVQESELKAVIAQKPERTATSLPDGFKAMPWQDWERAVAEYAKFQLQSMAGMDWYNPRAAAQAITNYNHFVGTIRREITQQNPMTEMRVRIPFF